MLRKNSFRLPHNTITDTNFDRVSMVSTKVKRDITQNLFHQDFLFIRNIECGINPFKTPFLL